MVLTLKRSSRFAAIAAVPVLLAANAPLIGGASYEFVVRSTSTQTGNRESVVMRGRGVFAGDNAKIEIIESGPGREAFGNPGSYFLMTEGGTKMMIVDPSQKQYAEWNMERMMASVAGVVNALGGLVKMEISDLTIDTKELGAGETINGYPTKHVRLTQNYKMSTRVLGKTSWSKTESTTDYYFAPQLKAKNPFVQNSQAWANQFNMFNKPEYKAQMAKAQEKLKDVPIKTVVTTVTTHDTGKQETTTVTSEMVNFKNMDVPKSVFEIPAGYQLVQLTADPTSVGARQDSLDNRGTTAPAPKENAADQAKKKLKGIFKR